MNERVFVIYHGAPGSNDGCCDGFTAAWAAWRALGDEACYIPAEYGSALPDIPDNARVYMLDVSYPRSVLDELARRTRLLVVDHHPTAEEALQGAPYAYFDLERSGAALAWITFHPDTTIPNLCLFVEDRDIWKWTMDQSRAVNAAIANTPREFRQWDRLEKVLRFPDDHGNVPYRIFLQTGQALLREQERLIQHCGQNAYIAPVGGIPVPVCNATAYVSELGEHLLARYPEYPFVGIWQRRADGLISWSLRSRTLPDGKASFHVGNFAREKFGGGGHASAAGFRKHALDAGALVGDLKDFLGEAMAAIDPNTPKGRELHDRYRHWRRGKTLWLGERDPHDGGPGEIIRAADD